jgi:hypothetical protein
MKVLHNILIVTTLAFVAACDVLDGDDGPELPPVTKEGKGTLGCLVNEQVFLQDAPVGFGTGVFAEAIKRLYQN